MTGPRIPRTWPLRAGLIVLVLMVHTPAFAHAAPATAAIRLAPAVGPPTSITQARGVGYESQETVDLAFDGHLQTITTANAQGRFSTSVTIPARALPGPHTVTATGASSGLTAEATFTVRTDWPQFHFSPDHVGVNPYENVLSLQNVSGLQVGWTFTMDTGVWTDPVVAGGIVYAGSTDTFYAVDAATGQPLWTRFERYADWTEPGVWQGRLYVGSLNGEVYALNARTGKLLWAFYPGAGVFNLTVADGAVFVGTSQEWIYKLDGLTGQVMWIAQNVAGDTPTVAGGRVYVGGTALRLTVLDEATGEVLWTAPTGGYLDSTPAVVRGMVFVGSHWSDDKVYAFPAAGCGQATCSPVWTFTTGDSVESSPAVWQGTVFIGSGDGNLYALDAVTGQLRWSQYFGGSNGFGLASPAVGGGVVFVGDGTDSAVHALDPSDGTVLWTYQTGDFTNSPAVVNGWVYIGSFDTNLYAFHLPGV